MKKPEEIKKGLEYLSITDVAQKVETAKRGLPYAYAEDIASDALAYIRQLEAQVPKWISVKDRLPEDGQKVLVCGTRKGMQVGTFRGLVHPFDAMCWWWKKDTRLDVTHWTPLPEPPGR